MARLYLDSFAREVGANKTLGQGYFEAVVNTHFQSATNKCPFIRTAFLATNMACPQAKIIDGVARLVKKTDIQSLSSKKQMTNVLAAESLLDDAWTLLKTGVQNNTISDTQSYSIFGRLSSRVVLMLIKKEKDGLERKQYKTFAAIKDQFTKELLTATGGQLTGHVEYRGFTHGAAPSSSQEKDVEAPVGMAAMSDPVFIAKEQGFEVGKTYKIANENSYFRLESFTESVNFKQIEASPEATLRKVQVSFQELKKVCTLYKGKLQSMIDKDYSQHMCANNSGIQRDVLRCQLFTLLVNESYNRQYEVTNLTFFQNPSEVRVKAEIKKGALMLFPFTVLAKISVNSANL